MRIAVISDIHSNLEALRQVLIDIENSNIDTVVCLGDNIGYGPEPNKVVTLIQDHNIPSIMGNHELAVINQNYLSSFHPVARKSLQMTVELLSEKTVNFISRLKPSLTFNKYRFVHGFPPNSATTYLFQVSDDELQLTFEQMEERICFIGHTHKLKIIEYKNQFTTQRPLDKSLINLNMESRYIINVGSVGQPRDGNNNAKYIILDTSNYSIEVKFIPYDIYSVINKIIAAGLPVEHANRLL